MAPAAAGAVTRSRAAGLEPGRVTVTAGLPCERPGSKWPGAVSPTAAGRGLGGERHGRLPHRDPGAHRRAAKPGGRDGMVFTSSSTVDRLVDAVCTDAVPPLVVSIGPATSATAASYDLAVTVEASEHTIEGAVAALIAHASTWPS